MTTLYQRQQQTETGLQAQQEKSQANQSRIQSLQTGQVAVRAEQGALRTEQTTLRTEQATLRTEHTTLKTEQATTSSILQSHENQLAKVQAQKVSQQEVQMTCRIKYYFFMLLDAGLLFF